MARQRAARAERVSNKGAAGAACTSVAVPESPKISSVLGDTFHFVGKLKNPVGF